MGSIFSSSKIIVGSVACILILSSCKSSEPKAKAKEPTTPTNSFDDFGNPIDDSNEIPLGQKLAPTITSNQVVSGVAKANAGSELQINFVISNIPEGAKIGVGLAQKPSGAGLTNAGRYPTLIWPFAAESTTAYPVELIVRDVNECLRLGGNSNNCWLSEGDQLYTKDARFDTSFTFSLEVGDNVTGGTSTGLKGFWEKFKNFFKRG